jgi:hypothetical protein
MEGKFTLPIPEDFVEEVSAYITAQEPHWVVAQQPPKTEFLSRSAINSLENSISKYGNKTFGQLTNLSHDKAWQAAQKNAEMSIIEIAKDAGANESMLSYIKETM